MNILKMEILAWNLILRQKKYYIIHCDNIIKSKTDLRKNGKITFYSKGNYLRGKLVLTSDEQDIIVAQLKEKSIPGENQILNNNLEEFKCFVVRFKSNSRSLSYAVINNSDINWNKSDGNDLILNNGVQGENIYASITEHQAYHELNALKTINFNGIIEPSQHHDGPDSPNWILIQYSSGLNNFRYEVIEEKLTEYRTDLTAYFRNNKTIYQAKVLKRSLYFYDVLQTLEYIESNLYAKRGSFINHYSSYIESLQPFDLINFQLLSIFQRQNVDYYSHHDGRVLDFLNEKAERKNGIQLKIYTEPPLIKIETSQLSAADRKVRDWLFQLQHL